MKQKTIFGIMAICLILLGITVVGIGLSNRDTTIIIAPEKTDVIKERYGVDNLNVNYTDLGCKEDKCYFIATSSIINGEPFSVDRYITSIDSKTNETIKTELTDNEIVALRDAWAENRYDVIYDAVVQRNAEDAKEIVYKDIGGVGTVVDK